MPVKVEIPYGAFWDLALSRDQAFQWFADVEKSVATTFPGIEKFEKVGDLTYRWIFERLSYGGHHLGITLCTKFSLAPATAIVAEPVPGADESQLSLRWSFSDKGTGGTTVRFDAKLALVLPLPGILKGMATPIAQKEIGKLFERYHSRVAQSIP